MRLVESEVMAEMPAGRTTGLYSIYSNTAAVHVVPRYYAPAPDVPYTAIFVCARLRPKRRAREEEPRYSYANLRTGT